MRERQLGKIKTEKHNWDWLWKVQHGEEIIYMQRKIQIRAGGEKNKLSMVWQWGKGIPQARGEMII